jgi:hypothetical protein
VCDEIAKLTQAEIIAVGTVENELRRIQSVDGELFSVITRDANLL